MQSGDSRAARRLAAAAACAARRRVPRVARRSATPLSRIRSVIDPALPSSSTRPCSVWGNRSTGTVISTSSSPLSVVTTTTGGNGADQRASSSCSSVRAAAASRAAPSLASATVPNPSAASSVSRVTPLVRWIRPQMSSYAALMPARSASASAALIARSPIAPTMGGEYSGRGSVEARRSHGRLELRAAPRHHLTAHPAAVRRHRGAASAPAVRRLPKRPIGGRSRYRVAAERCADAAAPTARDSAPAIVRAARAQWWTSRAGSLRTCRHYSDRGCRPARPRRNTQTAKTPCGDLR